MNDFEFKRQRRADRYRELAQKHDNLSDQRHNAASRELEMIPPGQPILVGHHSEKGHRAHLKRIDRHFAKAKEHHDKADYFRRRAAAVDSNRAIFSDDPDASEKLIDKLERLKKGLPVFKPVLTTPEEIPQLSLEANIAALCAGLILWMHTFSPSKMWIGGLCSLRKPFLFTNGEEFFGNRDCFFVITFLIQLLKLLFEQARVLVLCERPWTLANEETQS